MAQTESDREDLMEEAVALRQRVEFALPGAPQSIVAGFRVGGEFSIYFGGDSAFHFDAQGRLRRAFADGLLYRTQGNTLARLRRERSPTATHLSRHDLDNLELVAFVDGLCTRLVAVRAALDTGQAHVLRQVSEDDALFALVSAKIDEILSNGPLLAPAIRGKR